MMTTRLRVWIVAVMCLAVGGLIYMSSPSQAGDKGDLKAIVIKIGDSIKEGSDAAATKAAAAAVKNIEEVGDIMHMFRPRDKKGMGVGLKKGANKAKDGIEVRLRDLARDVPAGVAKEAEALETTGYWIAALAELTKAKGFEKYSGKKSKKAWDEWSDDMRAAGIDFAKAAAGKGGQQIKAAAAKVNAACNNCHSTFKE